MATIILFSNVVFRFCARLIPVSVVCPAYVDDIKKTARGILEEFHEEPAKVLKVRIKTCGHHECYCTTIFDHYFPSI